LSLKTLEKPEKFPLKPHFPQAYTQPDEIDSGVFFRKIPLFCHWLLKWCESHA